MLEKLLGKRGASFASKITVKTAVMFGVAVLAVILPQIVHIILGAQGGMRWLPMYLPVLLGGCLLGSAWGLGAGLFAPLVSFAFTSLTGNAMPVAERLPYMMAELAVFAAVSGAFSDKIAQNGWFAFPAVLLAQVSGRLFYLLSAFVFSPVSPLDFAAAWSQVCAGVVGLVAQAVFVPLFVMFIKYLAGREKGHD